MASSSITIHAFTGFLGQLEDWNFLKERITIVAGRTVEWRPAVVDPREGEEWTDWTSRWLSENRGSEQSGDYELLLGYSLGGRAAAHLALAAPQRFRGLVAISAHPGLGQTPENDRERAQRVEADERWASRFAETTAEEDWTKLLEDWNSQAVFGGVPLPSRLKERSRTESPELRTRCVRQLRQLSLSRQRDLSSGLRALPISQRWITGERDPRFTALATTLAEGSAIRTVTVPHAGHRWPWELPETEATLILLRAIEDILKENHS